MNPRIKTLLESAYSDFHTHFHRERDPVSFAHRYENSRDKEVAAFFAAVLAYGNVPTILNSVSEVLGAFGDSPFKAMMTNEDPYGERRFTHRFTTQDDIRILSFWLGSALRSHGSIEAFFGAGNNGGMKERLSSFVSRLTAPPLPSALAILRKRRERNLKYLISDPARGSACKRLNMFLRWMVRTNDGVDLGLWTSVPASLLVLPIDTHLLKTLRALGWTRSKQATWRVAEQATARLRLYAPEDPTRYDFSLCHLSMSGRSIRNYARME